MCYRLMTGIEDYWVALWGSYLHSALISTSLWRVKTKDVWSDCRSKRSLYRPIGVRLTAIADAASPDRSLGSLW